MYSSIDSISEFDKQVQYLNSIFLKSKREGAQHVSAQNCGAIDKFLDESFKMIMVSAFDWWSISALS